MMRSIITMKYSSSFCFGQINSHCLALGKHCYVSKLFTNQVRKLLDFLISIHPFNYESKVITCYFSINKPLFNCNDDTWSHIRLFKQSAQKDIAVLVQLLSHVRLFAIPWTAACQASLSFTISQSFLKPISTAALFITTKEYIKAIQVPINRRMD